MNKWLPVTKVTKNSKQKQDAMSGNTMEEKTEQDKIELLKTEKIVKRKCEYEKVKPDCYLFKLVEVTTEKQKVSRENRSQINVISKELGTHVVYTFKARRKKNNITNKEFIELEAYDGDKVEKASSQAMISAPLSKLENAILELYDYGIVCDYSDFDKVSTEIKKHYLDIKPTRTDCAPSAISANIIKKFFKDHVYEYIKNCKENSDVVSENTVKMDDFGKKIIETSDCYCIPVISMKEIYNDTVFTTFRLTEIKEALKSFGYTKTNTGRNDYTLKHKFDDENKSKCLKGMAFKKQKFEEVKKNNEKEKND